MARFPLATEPAQADPRLKDDAARPVGIGAPPHEGASKRGRAARPLQGLEDRLAALPSGVGLVSSICGRKELFKLHIDY